VLTTDPYVQNDPDILPLDDVVAKSDVLVLCAPHSVYRSLDLQGKFTRGYLEFLETGTGAAGRGWIGAAGERLPGRSTRREGAERRACEDSRMLERAG
jgi:hypothetical protein